MEYWKALLQHSNTPILQYSLFLCLFFLFGALPATRAQSLSDAELAQIQFEQKLHSQLSLDLPFRDELGQPVTLKHYFTGQPVILVLGYYECPMLCSAILNGLVQSLDEVKWTIGDQFQIINVSIDPAEVPALAAAKKQTYLKRYGRAPAAQGWHFLTGQEPAIKRLAGEVGFHYAYDPSSRQFAHPSGFVVLTPQGKIARYFFGVSFPPKDLQSVLQAAASNEIGSPIKQLLYLCFHYNPLHGKYSQAIMWVLRSLALLTVIGFFGGIAWLVRRTRPAHSSQEGVNSPAP